MAGLFAPRTPVRPEIEKKTKKGSRRRELFQTSGL